MPKNKYGEPLRICMQCEPHHYENCGMCFGFGVTRSCGGDGSHHEQGIWVPVSAGKSEEYRQSRCDRFVQLCPECGSGPNGVPTETVKNDVLPV